MIFEPFCSPGPLIVVRISTPFAIISLIVGDKLVILRIDAGINGSVFPLNACDF
jgi:hypothetical protein